MQHTPKETLVGRTTFVFIKEQLELNKNEFMTSRALAVAVNASKKVNFTPNRIQATCQEAVKAGLLEKEMREGRVWFRLAPEVKQPTFGTRIHLSQPQSPTISAEDLVQAIFLYLEDLQRQNEDLKEENRQLRLLAGKEQRKPLEIPSYISSLVQHGD